jgi:hypothetical protein
MNESNDPWRGGRTMRGAGLLVAVLLMTATVTTCTGESDPTRAAATTLPPATSEATTIPAPTRSTAATAALPRPIREVEQGGRVFGVYWVAASSPQLAPVERRLLALGYPVSSGDLDCDQGARRALGVPTAITSKVALYFGTEKDARAFAEGVDVRPSPNGHAAATLYCLD